jgi:hypothetical protein
VKGELGGEVGDDVVKGDAAFVEAENRVFVGLEVD